MCESSWYEVTEGPQLAQGDFLRECPLLALPKGLGYPKLMRLADGEVVGDSIRVEYYDVIVMSQSCDLEHDKVDLVMLCKHRPLSQWEAAVNARFSPAEVAEMRDAMRKGHYAYRHLLNRCQIEGFEQEIQIVDFRSVYGLPLKAVKGIATSLGPRLRLRPPYREHLSQAFARYFMRVGLPADIEFDC